MLDGIFDAFGRVEKIEVVKDPAGNSMGYGFVTVSLTFSIFFVLICICHLKVILLQKLCADVVWCNYFFLTQLSGRLEYTGGLCSS